MTFLPVLHRENKIMKGYFKNLKSQPSSKSLYEQEYDIKKISYFFLGTIFWLPHAKFCCIVVLLQLGRYLS